MAGTRVVLRLAVASLTSVAGSVHAGEPEATVLVRGGTFRMGTPAAAIPELKQRYAVSFRGVFEDEVPAREVSVGDFRMDRDEVTNERFLRFVAARPEWSRERLDPAMHNGHYLELLRNGQSPPGKETHPVVFVTWHAALAYCRWAGGRLPREAEWEYAARAGGTSEFPWGDEPPTPDRANYAASGVGDTRPVGSYASNLLGLRDMAGNVWELALDAWGPAGPGPRDIPAGSSPDDLRVVTGRRALRGGSYGGAPVNLRTRWRDSHEVRNAVAFVGFRCVYPPAGDARRPPP
jgi:formylglycine-generating enzyme required for sulfatase activity